MRILLLTSPAPPKAISPFSTAEKLMPLGLGYLASVLRSKGHEVALRDLYVSDDIPPDFSVFDFVGIYCNTVCLRGTRQLLYEAELCRRRGWHGKVIVGGPHTAVAPETLPDTVDYICQGEGEEAIIDIVENQPPERIIRKERVTDLDSLPLPAYDLFIDGDYDKTTEMIPGAKNVFSYSTSRGCPFQCSFCSSKTIWGRRFTSKSAEKVVDELAFLKREYGIDGVYFREDNFTVNRQRVLEICERMMSLDLGLKWATESRVDTLDDEALSAMWSAGCRGLYFGVEAGNERRMKALLKDISIEQVESIFKKTADLGFFRYASFIIDTPEETSGDRKDLLSLAQRIEADRVSLNHFTALPGSELYAETLLNRAYSYVDDVGLLIMPRKRFPEVEKEFTQSNEKTLRERLSSILKDPHPFKRILKGILYRLDQYLDH